MISLIYKHHLKGVTWEDFGNFSKMIWGVDFVCFFKEQ